MKNPTTGKKAELEIELLVNAKHGHTSRFALQQLLWMKQKAGMYAQPIPWASF